MSEVTKDLPPRNRANGLPSYGFSILVVLIALGFFGCGRLFFSRGGWLGSLPEASAELPAIAVRADEPDDAEGLSICK